MAKNINISYDWLSMFTKVSERLYLAFFVKMGKTSKEFTDKSLKNIRAKHMRHMEKSRRRQAYFISDYVQTKYFHLYTEAAQFYNALNMIYPTKNDLRKTDEYKNWKRAINGENLRQRRKYNTQQYENIDESEAQTPENVDEPEPQAPESVDEPEPQTLESVDEPEPLTPENVDEPEPQTPENVDEPEPQTFESVDEPEPLTPENVDEPEPQTPDHENVDEPEPQTLESVDEPEPQAPENVDEPELHTDRMRLEIPLFNCKPPSNKPTTVQGPIPAVHTQTVETVTEEVLDQSVIENNFVNQLTTERIDEILNEIRQDPDFLHVFDEIEHNVLMDTEIAECIEIETDTRLETELYNW